MSGLANNDSSARDWQAALPSFSQTVFRTAPYLGLGANAESPRLVGGISEPSTLAVLPELASRLRQHAAASGRSRAVEAATAASTSTSSSNTLPTWLLTTLQQHQREIQELFRRWEAEGLATVPLGQFAQSVRAVCGVTLSDDELRQLVTAVQPSMGEPPAGRLIRLQQFDFKLLTRAVTANAKRAASNYIRQASFSGASS